MQPTEQLYTKQTSLRECCALAACDHPGIVRPRAIFWVGDRCVLLLPRLHVWRADHLVEQAVFCAHVASAVRHLHTRGIVHTDLKPANIMREDGRPVIIDLSHACEPGEEVTTNKSFYHAPEVNAGCAHATSDLFSVAMLTARLLVEERFFALRYGWDDAGFAERVAELVQNSLPGGIAQPLAGLLAIDPKRRRVEDLLRLEQALSAPARG